jgi:hypothetical protein
MPKFKVGDIVICDKAEEPWPVKITSILKESYLVDEDKRTDKAFILFESETEWRLYYSSSLEYEESKIRKEIYG